MYYWMTRRRSSWDRCIQANQSMHHTPSQVHDLLHMQRVPLLRDWQRMADVHKNAQMYRLRQMPQHTMRLGVLNCLMTPLEIGRSRMTRWMLQLAYAEHVDPLEMLDVY